MFYKLRSALACARFNRGAKGILKAPAITYDTKSPVVFVSMLCQRDVLFYLVALKSFAQYIQPSRVYIIDDGSLTAASKETLYQHIPVLRIVPIQSIDTGKCPRGGTWERLLFIAERVNENYVIQMDADTLTLSDVSEVTTCINTNRSFIIGTYIGQSIVNMSQVSKLYTNCPGTHVQIQAETSFSKIQNASSRYYVRGCAGFFGIAPRSISRTIVEKFSLEMESILGKKKWMEWGSEQVTVNYLIANIPQAVVLPIAQYVNYNGKMMSDKKSFVHFYGTHRFKNGQYLELTKKLIKQLS